MNRRLAVLILSIGSVVGFGYALGGLGGYLLGKGDMRYVAGGLTGGFAAALGALRLWKDYLAELAELAEEISDREDPPEV